MTTGRDDVTLRPATPAEVTALSDLALRSKGVWGYDAAFLEACRAELTITVEHLAARRVTVAEAAGGIAGFSALVVAAPAAELLDLFVEPAQIGTGVGRALWTDALAAAARGGASWVDIEADPHAAPWYERHGAVQVGTVPSGSIAGRALPLLRVHLDAS